MIFFFNGWWYDGEFEPEVSTILGEKYNPDEWTLEDALADIKEKYCPGGFDWNEDHWGVEGYGKTFTITIGDEDELALTAMYSLPPAPDTKVEYSILDESAKTCAITHVGQAYFNDEVTAFEIPETVELEGGTYTVTAIGDNAFNGCRNMASVTIPNTVTSIGRRAFYFVEKSEGGLTQITIPNSVTSIGEEAFYGCHYLETVTLSENITSIPNGCFGDCWNLKNINSEDGVEIPGKVTSIGNNAFYNCQYQLAKVTIPDGVTYIGDHAFYSCHQLTSISVPSSVEFVGSTAFPTYSDDNLSFIVKDGAKYLGYSDGETEHCVVLINYAGSDETVILDSECKFIYQKAFSELSKAHIIESVTLPEGLKGIGNEAFIWCSLLTEVYIPDGVTYIGNEAFFRCNRMQSIRIPSSVETIGEDAFTLATGDDIFDSSDLYFQKGNGLYLGNDYNPCLCLAKPVSRDIAELEIDSRCQYILTSALYGCANLINLDIPESVTSIGNYAFADGIININYDGTAEDSRRENWGAPRLNDPVNGDFIYADEERTVIEKYIGSSEIVTVPAGVTVIGEEAFRGRSITSVTLPDGVVEIGEYAFSNCTGLTSIVLPNTVENIGQYAFSNCDGLTSVYIPEGVTSIGQYAFQHCRSLVSVVVPESVENMGFYAFNQCDRKIVIFCMRDKEPEDLDYNTPWNRLWNGGYEENYGDIKYNVVWRQNPEGSGFESDNIYCSNDGLLYFVYRVNGEEVPNIDEDALYNLTTMYGDVSFSNGDAIVIGYRGNRSEALDLTIPYSVGNGNNVAAIARYAFYGENIGSLKIGNTDGSALLTIGQGAFCKAELSKFNISDDAYLWFKHNGYEEPIAVTNMNAYELASNSCEYEYFHSDSKLLKTFYVQPEREGSDCDGSEEKPFRYFAQAINAIKNSCKNGYTDFTIRFALMANENKMSYMGDSVANSDQNDENIGFVGHLRTLEDDEYAQNARVSIDFSNVEFQYFLEETFSGLTNLVGVVLPEGITTIPQYAFQECYNLDSVNIPSTVTSMGGYAFDGCEMLEKVTYASVKQMCSIQYTGGDGGDFGSNPLQYSNHLFIGENEITVLEIVDDDITEINNWAFYGCGSITSVTIGSSVMSIGDEAFRGCHNLTSVTLAEGVQNLAYKAFNECAFAEFNIPSTVKVIWNNTFDNCDNLESIFIPSNVETMGYDIFNACDNLRAVYCEAASQPDSWENGWDNNGFDNVRVFWSVQTIGNLLCSVDSKTLTIAVVGAVKGAETVEIPLNTNVDGNEHLYTSIADYAFYNNADVKSVSIGSNVNSIGRCAFGKTNLTADDFTIPDVSGETWFRHKLINAPDVWSADDLVDNIDNLKTALAASTDESSEEYGYAYYRNKTEFIHVGVGGYSDIENVIYSSNMFNDEESKNTKFVIYVDGTLNANQTLPSNLGTDDGTDITYFAKSILIMGSGTDAKIDAGWRVDGSGSDNNTPALSIYTNVPVTIRNLTITGGSSENAGGVFAKANSDLTIAEGTVIEGNNAYYYGGGVRVYDGKLTMTGGKITNNQAGGTGAGGGIWVNGTADISGGEISNNYAAQSGGGIYVAGRNTTIHGNVVIKDNRAAINGSGIYVEQALQWGGAATVEGGNDIYLTAGKYITITEELDCEMYEIVAIISLDHYDNDIRVVEDYWEIIEGIDRTRHFRVSDSNYEIFDGLLVRQE